MGGDASGRMGIDCGNATAAAADSALEAAKGEATTRLARETDAERDRRELREAVSRFVNLKPGM
jgi:hypothetical protein